MHPHAEVLLVCTCIDLPFQRPSRQLQTWSICTGLRHAGTPLPVAIAATFLVATAFDILHAYYSAFSSDLRKYV